VDARNVDVWLPEDYSPSKKYAVLYMQDGQMLFDSATTWNHMAWKVDETMNELLHENKISDCIVVGIWNNGIKRHAEYFPQKALPYIPDSARKELMTLMDNTALADNYLKFLVFELKPFIDSSFSTKKDRSNTFVAGSSMGGLISLYAICEYPDVFGGAACMSTHWTGIYRADHNPIPFSILKYMSEKLPSPNHHKIYFDHGTKTLDSLYTPFQEQVDSIMKKKGYTNKNFESKIFEGADHSEASWAKRLAIPLEFLLKK
jgi:enterochelin esterase-like enzyme